MSTGTPSDPVVDGLIDHCFGPGGAPVLNQNQLGRITGLREGFRILARHVAQACPNTFEREQAVLSLDEAMSWAVKAIARGE